MEAAKNLSKQFMTPTFFLLGIVLILLSIVLTGLVNTKVDGVSNEKITIGRGRVGAGTNTPNEITWVQPKMTLLKSITIVCTSAAAIASGSIGYSVGTTSGGVDIVAADTNKILTSGLSVVVGAVYPLALVGVSAYDTSPTTVNVNFTPVKRKLYFDITHTSAATDPGYFSWVVEYIAV